MADYTKMTTEEFDEILREMVVENVGSLLSIPGVYEAVKEHFNNGVLDEWAERNPEKAYPKFEIWATQGQGGAPVEECETLEEALETIKELEGDASFAIKLPSGGWYEHQESSDDDR